MSQPGETDHFSLEDHVRALQKHSFEGAVDIVVTHSNKASSEILEKYKKMGSEPIKVVEKEHTFDILYRDILSFEDNLIRHDSNKIRDIVKELIEQIG